MSPQVQRDNPVTVDRIPDARQRPIVLRLAVPPGELERDLDERVEGDGLLDSVRFVVVHLSRREAIKAGLDLLMAGELNESGEVVYR